jgi:hypothetical protein
MNLSAQVLAETLLRRQKLRQQVGLLSEALYLFQEVTVGRAIAIERATKEIQAQEYPKITTFLENGHTDDNVCTGLCCYRSSGEMVSATLVLLKTTEADIKKINPAWSVEDASRRWADIPFRPITGNGLFHLWWKKVLG